MIRKAFVIFYVILCFSFSCLAITDAQFFSAINLDYDGLQTVKKYVISKNYTKAKIEYVNYLKKRKSPVWYVDRNLSKEERKRVGANIGEADKYVKNELVSCGIWHKFGTKVNWIENPTINNYNEWVWQLNRHYFWITLGQAYWHTGDEKYAKAFVLQLNSWISQCKRPSDDGNYEGSAWRTLETGLRMMYSWPYAFYYFLDSPSFDNESIVNMIKSLYDHTIHITSNLTDKNRQSQEMNGLFTIGTLFPEFYDAERWRTLAVEKLYKEESDEFYMDGAQKELAPSYHRTNLTCLASVYKLAQLNNYSLPQEFIGRLENLYEYFQKLMMPNGLLPAVNDSRWQESREYLANAADYFDRRSDFLYTSTDGNKGKLPAYTSVWMPWAGWYVMRSGWSQEDIYSFFEVGPYGIGHQHEDKLSFILYAYGNLLITECGNYSYDSSEWRKYAISARGHNVARVDGMDQNRATYRNDANICQSLLPMKNKWISNKKYDSGEGYYTEGFGPNSNTTVTHYRTLKFLKKQKCWIVTDEFIPSDNMEHSYDIWFHFNTEKYEIDSSMNVVYSNNDVGANIAILRIGETKNMDVVVGQNMPEVQGWVSDGSSDDGFILRKVATPIYHRKGVGPNKEVFIFYPFASGERVRINKVQKMSSIKYRIYLNNGKNFIVKF